MGILKTAQDIANEIAQKNATELLGLPPNNTNIDRARALGFDVDGLLYHGSVKDIDAFDPSIGNVEGHLGQSIYLTDNPVDASINYANKQSPDLVSKATINTWEDEPEKWIENFADNEGVVYPVFARKGNQLDLTKEGDDYIDFLSEFDDEGNLIKESENVEKVYNTLYDSQSQYDGISPEDVMVDLQMYDELPARDFDDSIRFSKDLMYATDDLGQNASNEVIRKVYDDLGYDSVKLNANESFENLMAGFDNSNHTMVMKPENVRSRFAAFDPKKLGIGAGSIVSTNLLASEADRQKALEDKIAKYGELKAPERNSFLGLLADVGKFTIPDWLNSAPSLVDDMSYGYSGVKNVSGYPTPDARFVDMADFIPFAGAAGLVKLGKKSFPQFTEEALSNFKKQRIIPEAERIGNAPMPDDLVPFFNAYKQGDISYSQYNDKVMEHFPPNKFDKVPELTPVDDIGMALKPTQTKEGKGILGAGASIDNGTKVKSRLDINAYNNYGIWSTSIKGATDAGKDATVYGQTAHLVSKGDDKVKFTGSGDRALAVAEGGAKSPFATMDGYFKDTKPEDARKLAEKYMNDPNWVQVGMNPRRAGYFYDKADGMPVGSADEVIQIGALVLAKNAKKFDPSESLTKRVNPKTGGLLSF